MPREDRVIRRVGWLVLVCAAVLVISAALLVGTALQVMRGIDAADLGAERERAALAIAAMSEATGPLTALEATYLGRVAGLRDAHLSMTPSTDPSQQQILLLGRQGPPGSYLTWTRSSLAEQLFRQFAPIRLPIIGGMMLIVLALLLRMRRLVVDIERQRRLAVQQSHLDTVTGFANRLAFETDLTRLALEGTPFAVVLFDLDRFKQINDAHGHAAGDEVLTVVAQRLSRQLHAGDMVARLGGDEFVLLITSRLDRARLSYLAEACIGAIEQPIPLGKTVVRVGVSLGIASLQASGLSASTLVNAADTALYRAKSVPGSCYRFAHDLEPLPVLRTALSA